MGELGGLLPFVLMLVVIFFFMIRPQMKRQKQEKEFSANLKKGDKVVTKSGMHGKILDFSEKLDAVIIETGAGKITFDRSSISLELSSKLNNPKDDSKK
jgi:preprotein translocase subunit YajC